MVRARSQAECFTGPKQQLKPNNSTLRRKIWFRRHGTHPGVMAAKRRQNNNKKKLNTGAVATHAAHQEPLPTPHERGDLSPALQWRLAPDEAVMRFLACAPIRPSMRDQVTGTAFMLERYHRRLPPKHVRGGGVLDAMRMGKCQTVIVFLLQLLQHRVRKYGIAARLGGTRSRPVLIIGTKECVPRWQVLTDVYAPKNITKNKS